MQKRLTDVLGSSRTATAVAVAVFVILIALLSFGQFSYNDFWWHLALGKWMLASKSFLTHDIFSQHFSGKLWLNGTWLFDGLLYLLFSKTSFAGLTILRFLVFGATYFFFIRASLIKQGTKGLLFAVIVFLLCIPQTRNLVRPEIMQNLFIGIFLFSLYSFKYEHKKYLYLLPILEVIWVNTHGTFTMGIVLIAFFFGAELWRTMLRHRCFIIQSFKFNKYVRAYGIVLVLTCLASLANPYGYYIYILTHQILSDQESLRNIQEWSKIPFSSMFTFPLNASVAHPLYLFIAVGVLLKKMKVLWTNKITTFAFLRNVPYEEVTIFSFYFYMAHEYNRYLITLILISALIIVRFARVQTNGSTLLYLQAALGLMFIIIYTSGAHDFTLNTGPAYASMAHESIAFVLNEKPKGNLLNDYGNGSELSWQLFPAYKIFIDGRTPNVYDNDYYWYYRNMGDTNVLGAAINQFLIGFAIVPNNSRLYSAIITRKDWKLVFFDGSSAVVMKQGVGNDAIIDTNQYTILNPATEVRGYKKYCQNNADQQTLKKEIQRNLSEIKEPVYSLSVLAYLLMNCEGKTVENSRQAETILRSIISYQPDDMDAHANLGTDLIDLGREQEAVDEFKKSIQIKKNAQNMTGLGIALHNLGRYAEAEKVLKQIPALPAPIPNEFYQVYGRVSYQLDYNDRAIEFFKKYLDVADENEITQQDYIDIANAYRDAGDTASADNYIEKSKTLTHPTTTPAL